MDQRFNIPSRRYLVGVASLIEFVADSIQVVAGR